MKSRGIEKVLVTGGAGFIGSHTTDLLAERGYQITILDNLEPQVHRGKKPSYLNKEAKFLQGDVGNRETLKPLVKEADAVIHLASAVGIGQSMYQIEKYVDSNTKSTATLLDVLVNEEHEVKKVVVASSMSIYGEGEYFCERCESKAHPGLRSESQLKKSLWEHPCPACGSPLKPIPTPEDKPLMPASIYAMSKRHQEEMCLLIGKTYGISTIALRYFNVYGSRQSLSNPYTGCAAIFTSRILNNREPYIFEDGNQTRDFIHVRDVAEANLKALETSRADHQAVNIGSGQPRTIYELAENLITATGSHLIPKISNTYRKGDIRHCYANVTRAKELLDFTAKVSLTEGLKELIQWASQNRWGAVDLFDKAYGELKEKGLA
jgi:dTDP-L-rhamnose 4-epimerase